MLQSNLYFEWIRLDSDRRGSCRGFIIFAQAQKVLMSREWQNIINGSTIYEASMNIQILSRSVLAPFRVLWVCIAA
jgi:hypothetical protein